MKRFSMLQILNIVALVLTLIMNGLAQTSLFPNTVGELGESRAIFFLPDGYVFAIWGVIYIGLLAYVIYQARPSQKDSDVVQSIGWWFVISSIANITWLILFIYNLIWLSTLAMLVIFGSLLMIYLQLGIGKKQVSLAEKWAVHIPFSIYLGWISVATIANVSTALYDSGFVTSFAGITADVWASVLLVIAAILALAMLYLRGDVAYALVIVWASYGINARSFETELYEVLSSLNSNLVNTTALSIALIIGIAAIVSLALSFRKPVSA